MCPVDHGRRGAARRGRGGDGRSSTCHGGGEEEPDEPEEEEEDDSDDREDSAGLNEEDGGFVSQRRLGPYATQRLPGIRSIYTGSGRVRRGRKQIPASSRKFDAGDVEPPINGADHENGDATPNGLAMNLPILQDISCISYKDYKRSK